MQPSNFHVSVVALGHEQFVHVMNLFFDPPSRPDDLQDEYEYWSFSPEGGLALYTSDHQKSYIDRWNDHAKKSYRVSFGEKKKFEPKLPKAKLIEFVWDWLKQAPREYYGSPDDIDGSQFPEAWHIYTTYGYSDPSVIIKPTWAEYHK